MANILEGQIAVERQSETPGGSVQDMPRDDIPERADPAPCEGDGETPYIDADGAAVGEGEAQSAYLFSRQLTVLSDPTGVHSSAVGGLRNYLNQQHVRAGRRSLAVCSVGSDVDRTLIAANLAVTMVQAGASTVLVDANFRDSELNRFFIAPEHQPGLRAYLDGTVDDPAAIVRSEVIPNLSLVHAGPAPSDPQGLLASQRFEQLMNGLMRNFDFTIVDCPAANGSSDVRRIASVLRYALIVVKRDLTYVDDVKRLIEDLTADRVSVVGSFLNVG